MKENENIKDINIFNNVFSYSAYADDTTFFVSEEDSVIELMNAPDKFSFLSGLTLKRLGGWGGQFDPHVNFFQKDTF